MENKPLHVLFVDDDTDESYLFNEALEHSNLLIKLSRAIDGNHLLKILDVHNLPDIIFMDINMPYKDGIEALEEIRAIADFDKIPIVIYSTSSNQVYIESCYQKGADLYVIKPNDFEGMLEVVKKVCTMDWDNYAQPTREQFVLQLNDMQ